MRCQQKVQIWLYNRKPSGVNSNVIMSGCGDDNPDDEGREADRGNSTSVSRRANGRRSSNDSRRQRATVLSDQSSGQGARGQRSGSRQSGPTVSAQGQEQNGQADRRVSPREVPRI